MTGLDLIILAAVKDLIAPLVALTGSEFAAGLIASSPIVIGISSYLDMKIKKRGGKV